MTNPRHHRVDAEELAARIDLPSARGIASRVATLIRDQELGSGDLLPRVRDLAGLLRVSPSTVSAAWTLLRERGLVMGRGKSGTWVSSPADLVGEIQSMTRGHPHVDLRLLLPDPGLLPSLDQALLFASAQPGLSDYDTAGITPALEGAVRRTWPYPSEELIAASGAADGLWLVLRALSVPGDRVLLETPGSPPAVRIVRRLGLIPVELASDDDGPRPSSLRRGLKADPVAVVYQPRAQVPTGHVVSDERIRDIARILGRERSVVIEFDVVGDLSVSESRSLGTHLPHHTVLVKSFEKSHGPDLRMAVIGGTAQLMSAIHGHMLLERQWTSRILQGALAWLLDDPMSQQQVQTARTLYRQRRVSLANALTRHGIPRHDQDGLCLWISVAAEEPAVKAAAEQGVLVYPGSSSFPNGDDGYIRVATSRLAGGVDQVASVLGNFNFTPPR